MSSATVVLLNVKARTFIGHANSMFYKCRKCRKGGIQAHEALLPGSGIRGSELLKVYELCGEFPAGTTAFIDPMHPLKVGDLAKHVLCRGCADRYALRFLNVVETMERWLAQNLIFLEEFGKITVPEPAPELSPQEAFVESARTWPGLACGHCKGALNASKAMVGPLDELHAEFYPGLTTAPPLTVEQLASQVRCPRCYSFGSFPYLKTAALLASMTVMGRQWHKQNGTSPRRKQVVEDVIVVSDLPVVETFVPKPQHRVRNKKKREGKKGSFKKGKKKKQKKKGS